jgi:Acyl-CoA reductase (LuxC)
MTLNERIDTLAKLGTFINEENEHLQAVIRRTAQHNAWFTIENQWKALFEIRDAFLNKEKLQAFVLNYPRLQSESYPLLSKKIGLILAGNIPMVGFHDILCVFLAGFQAKIKLSDKDPYLLPFIVHALDKINPASSTFFDLTDGFLKDFDAVIATGSNNSARYFESYFSKYPHIIRKNRNAVAVLRGDETADDFEKLGDDIFTYFGLGCRNVSKIYVPQGYDFEPLLIKLHERNAIITHDKYKNNFDYNFTLLILNKIPYFSNGCVLIHEQSSIASPIAVVLFEYYNDFEKLSLDLLERAEEIQCIVGNLPIEGLPSFPFGEAQKPRLQDFADGIDTMEFLSNELTNSTI